MKKIPFILIYSRIIIALCIIVLALTQPVYKDIIIVILMILGLLTDVFDGIIARKLNVSSEKLRVWDSNVDQFFWIAVIGSVFYLKFTIVKPLLLLILIIVLLEVVAYIISYLKFKRPIATHSLLAKFWTLTLLAFLIELTLNSTAYTFVVCFWVGLISRLEIIGIILMLKKWVTDVPSIFVVHKLNKGLKVKKNTLFNS